MTTALVESNAVFTQSAGRVLGRSLDVDPVLDVTNRAGKEAIEDRDRDPEGDRGEHHEDDAHDHQPPRIGALYRLDVGRLGQVPVVSLHQGSVGRASPYRTKKSGRVA
jgi:hypothetical protein